jgi:predicted nucleotidyltransferase
MPAQRRRQALEQEGPMELFPTPVHQRAAESIVAFFEPQAAVDAVLLVNSCARGQGTPLSDLDFAILVDPAALAARQPELERAWREFAAAEPAIDALRRLGPFSGVHLDFIDGSYAPEQWDDGGGPDGFELGIGNQVLHGRPLIERNGSFERMRATWLPYYGEELRRQRLAMVRDACLYDLEHVPFYAARKLYFQSFDRLYKALQEFLQALFISRRTYPLAYNKWIHEQVAGHLGLPELYGQLVIILELGRLAAPHLIEKGARLQQLVELWVVD